MSATVIRAKLKCLGLQGAEHPTEGKLEVATFGSEDQRSHAILLGCAGRFVQGREYVVELTEVPS
jgi:hypothetical protein